MSLLAVDGENSAHVLSPHECRLAPNALFRGKHCATIEAADPQRIGRWVIRVCARMDGRAAVWAERMPTPRAAVGGLDVDLGPPRQQAKRRAGRRHGHSEDGSRQHLTVGAIAQSDVLGIDLRLVRHSTTMT